MGDFMWLAPFVLEDKEDDCNAMHDDDGDDDRHTVCTTVVPDYMESKKMLPFYCSLLFPTDVNYTSLVETLDWKSHGKLSVPQFLAISRGARFMKLCTLLHKCTFTREDFDEWTKYTTSSNSSNNSNNCPRRADLRAFLLCPVCGTLAKINHRYWIMTYPLLAQPEDALELSRQVSSKHLPTNTTTSTSTKQGRRRRSSSSSKSLFRHFNDHENMTNAASHLMARLLCLPCLEKSIRIPQKHKRNLYEIPTNTTVELKEIEGQQSSLFSSSPALSSSLLTLKTSSDSVSCLTGVGSSSLSDTNLNDLNDGNDDVSVSVDDQKPALEVLRWYIQSGVWRTLEKQHVRFALQVQESRQTTLLRVARLNRQQADPCQYCKAHPAVLRCGACREPIYCSKPCQQADWTRHRAQECKNYSKSSQAA